MSRLVFSICTLAVTAVLCVCCCVVSGKSASKLSETAYSCVQNIKNENDIKKYAQQLEAVWEKQRKYMQFFVDEEAFEDEDEEIREIKYSNSAEDFKKKCEKVSAIAKQISESQKPFFENIF